jgi:RNA polymerase sigma factor (sigma-70 family)
MSTTRTDGAADLDEALRVYLAERSRLLAVAQRIVHDAPTAEEVVQEVWIRWQRADRREIRNPAAFLTTATTRLAINVISSAHRRHELDGDQERVEGCLADSAEHVEQAIAVECALQSLAVRVTPMQLAALLLHSCFGLSYWEVARMLGTTASNGRQLVRRALVKASGPSVVPADPMFCRRLVVAFGLASRTGRLSVLLDVVLSGRGVTSPTSVPC